MTVFEDAFNKTMNTDNPVCTPCCLVITTWWDLRPMVTSISEIIKQVSHMNQKWQQLFVHHTSFKYTYPKLCALLEHSGQETDNVLEHL